MSNIFRSRSYKKERFIQPVPQTTVFKTEVDETGTQIEVAEVMPINKVKHNLPDPKYYKISDLIAAGIPMNEIPVTGLLDSSDLHDIMVKRDKLTNVMLDKLSEYETKKNTTAVQDSVSDPVADPVISN